MAKTPCVAAFIDKGGTGKTTSVSHLGVGLDALGHDVLLIDLAGKQGDLAKHFGVWEDYEKEIRENEAWPNVSTVFDDAWDMIAEKLDDCVDNLIITTDEGPDLVPAHPGLDSLDSELGNIDDARERYSRLEQFLDQYIDPLSYEIVLIDLPGMTNNVSLNGLFAARNVIAPVEMGPFEAEQVAELRRDLVKIENNFSVSIDLALVLPNKVDTRTNLADEYLEAFKTEYPKAIAPDYIPYSQDIRNAAELGKTAFALDDPSTTAERARDAYIESAESLLEHLGVTPDVR
jgi:chromosome partitioning protein